MGIFFLNITPRKAIYFIFFKKSIYRSEKRSPRLALGTLLIPLFFLFFTPPLLAEKNCLNPLMVRKGVTISEELRSHLTSFAEEFCKTRGKPLVVTSGLRSAKTQARLMHRRLEQGDQLPYYQNQEAAQELLSTYHKDHSVAALHEQIADQISRDCYISKHLFSRAADIARHDPTYPLGKSDINELYKIAKQRGALIVDNEGGRKTHFHLNFPPYPNDPRKCPKASIEQ